MNKLLYIGLFLSILASPLKAADYVVDKTASHIEFNGQHVGNPFKGKFSEWDAVIKFDPNDLPGSSIQVTIDTSTAKTGDAFQDKTMPTADWFDVVNYPKATYVSSAITKNADGSYNSKGVLTIKSVSKDISFDFNLEPVDLKTPPIKAMFTVILNRVDLKLGFISDPTADYVSKDITLEVLLIASPK